MSGEWVSLGYDAEMSSCSQILYPDRHSLNGQLEALPGLTLRKCRTFFFFLILFIYLFTYGCVGSSFLCEGFLQLQQVGATLHRGARASHYRSLSCCGAQAPDAQAQ